MGFIPAADILGPTTPTRTLRLTGHPRLPNGEYILMDTYCTDAGCDCRKTMVLVYHERRHVSTIAYGWETTAFYQAWYGRPLDAQTRAEMQGPSIVLGSPDLVAPEPMLELFDTLLDDTYQAHFRHQYARFRAAIATPAGKDRVVTYVDRFKPKPNAPCSCGSGRKFKRCCGR